LLIDTTQHHLPQTVKTVKKIQTLLQTDKKEAAYCEVLVLPQTFASEANKFCLLIFDEFDQLEKFAFPDVYQELGKRIMTQKRCLYVVTSSMVAAAAKILGEKLSLLFGNFEVVPIEPFDYKTSEGFILARLGARKIGPALLSFLIDFTGGHPLYLKLICEELLALTAMHHQDEIYLPLLTRTLENVVFQPWGLLSRHFDLLLDRVSSDEQGQVVEDILTRLANGKQKAKDLAKAVGIKGRVLLPKVNSLVDAGVVIRNGNFYYLQDKLLRYWIRHVYQKRRHTIEYDLGQQKQAFQEEMRDAVHDFLLSSEKDLSARVIDLLHCFDDEAFQINNRRYKLPLFHQIVPTKTGEPMHSGYELIKAMSDEGPWFIVLSRRKISENDISLIVQESKKSEPRPQRCILISLNDLDEETRVRALQERMWIWNEGELAALLNLYNKPFILDFADGAKPVVRKSVGVVTTGGPTKEGNG